MARRSEGQVVERHWKSGRGYALRFRAYGERQYLTLGLETEGWDRKRAEEELANVMADVRRGFWTPPTRRRRSEERGERGLSDDGDLLFGPFARRVVAQREGEVSASYFRIMHWGLSHLLPYFADWPLADIDVEAVDAYRAFKVEESESIRRAIERRKPKLDEHGRPRRPLNATSINKTLKLLQWVLSIAVEYEHIDRNPAEGRRRRLPEPKHAPAHLDTVEQIQALLDACALLDRSPKRRSEGRVAVISTLLFAGPRAEELCNLLWRDVDLAKTGASTSAAPRPRPACARSTFCPSYATSSPPTRPAHTAPVPTTLSSRPRPAGGVTATTYEAAPWGWRSSAPTSCWRSAASPRCHAASRPTSCATPSPRSWSPPARTPPR
jgi:hypothetical protein